MRPQGLALILCVALSGCAGTKPAVSAAPADLNQVAPERLFSRGISLAEQGEFIAAEQYIHSAVKGGYPEREATLELVKVCLASARLRTALKYAEPYLERHPDDFPLRYIVATIYVGLGLPMRALGELELVRESAPDFANAAYLAGVVRRDELRDMPGASHEFAQYLSLEGDGEHAPEAKAFLRRHPAETSLEAVP